MPDEKPHSREGVVKSRIESLSDGIFAFAMTLMVISLAVPQIPVAEAPALLPGILAGMYNQFIVFVIAFFVISSYWVSHHQILGSVQFVNDAIIRINILFLFFIVLIPFTTATSGDYTNVFAAVILFHFNLLIASLLLTLLWVYITRHHAELNPGGRKIVESRQRKEKGLVIPGVTLLAIGVSFIDTSLSMSCYLLIPVLLLILKFRPGREKNLSPAEEW